MEDIIPNLFIVGAPKSGTTSLYQYLKSHPNIFMCTPKEPHYFSDDINNISIVKTLSEYQSLFYKREKRHKFVGEASVWYLYSDTAIKNIYKYNKKAKIIVMLRNPLDLYQSLHQHFIYNGYEDRKDMKDAWGFQLNRQQNIDIPKHCPDKKLLQYNDILKLGHQVERIYSIFPKKQIKIILFDDFTKHTIDTYKSTLSFLDLEYDYRKYFPNINKSREVRYKGLNQFFLNPPVYIKKIWNFFKKIFGNSIIELANKIILMNCKDISNNMNTNLEFKLELKELFRSEINKLSNIIDRDLNLWLK